MDTTLLDFARWACMNNWRWSKEKNIWYSTVNRPVMFKTDEHIWALYIHEKEKEVDNGA